MARGFASNYRIVLLATGVFGAFVGIGYRLVQLHVIDRQKLIAVVDKARRQIEVRTARRGDILDARGNILATSRSLIVIGVDPQMLRPQDEPKWPELAALLDMPLAKLQTIFRAKTRLVKPTSRKEEAPDAKLGVVSTDPEIRDVRWVKLSDAVDEATYDRIMKLDVKGVYDPPRTYSRAYPNNELAAHVVGYMSKEGVAVQGVERWADFYLRGRDGWRESEKDGHRRELAQFQSREVLPSDGYSVVLSIDSYIQHRAEEELTRIMATFKPLKATIIVSDAKLGFILAMANVPTFNPNEYNKLKESEKIGMRNFAVADYVEPGSTFKIVAASGALNDGLVTPDRRFDCTLESKEYNGRLRDLPGEAHAHAFDHPLSVTEIISHSSNKGAAQLGMLLGEKRLYEYAKAYGFGEYTGLANIYPESPGLFAHYTKWSGSDITRVPIGHTIAATPLQIHFAMGVIASGGELMRPQIIREIRDPQGETVFLFKQVVRDRVIDAKTAETMAMMLHRVTIPGEGTAPEAAIPNFRVAGKTGTTQKLINGHYSSEHHVGSFVGFFPANSPPGATRVLISVIVDDGKPPGGGIGYGTVVAAPSFKRIGLDLIQYLRIKPTDSELVVAVKGGGR